MRENLTELVFILDKTPQKKRFAKQQKSKYRYIFYDSCQDIDFNKYPVDKRRFYAPRHKHR